MLNFWILCRIWKHVNSAKHWIAIATKTVTGQYWSSTVLQQVNVQSDQQWKFLGVHTALCGSWNTASWGYGPKTGGVLGAVKYHSLSAMQTPMRRNRPNFRIPYFHPSTCRPCTVPPWGHAPFAPLPATTACSGFMHHHTTRMLYCFCYSL